MQTMKVHTFRSFLTCLTLACLIPAASAQFDDVYYDPDKDYQDVSTNYDDSKYNNYSSEDDVTYYDDEEYAYYDDYDYYYTSRIKRFHTPYRGFDFYDPVYVSYNYYDPFYSDAYYYPGSSIYISFGNSNYWNYRHWRNWNRYNRWNHYNHWDSWCSPSSYYYSYNSWYSPGHYWGGYHGYHSYSNYYNNYYNTCPSPVSNYYGITNTTITHINNGSTRGSYYGPRITGNTGSSPRGPVIKPENVQPVMRDGVPVPSNSNDTPTSGGIGTRDGVRNPVPANPSPGIDKSPKPSPSSRTNPSEDLSSTPVDKELDKEIITGSKRPIFRPYPSSKEPSPNPEGPTRTDRVKEQPSPSRDVYSPRPSNSRDETPSRNDQYQPSKERATERPVYTPPSRNDSQREERPMYTPRSEDRPSYNPPARSNDQNRAEERPRYTPPSRNDNSERSNDRPSYSPPSRSNDSGRSNDRPSYSPPSRSNDSGSSRSYSPPSRDNSPSSSGSSGSRSSSSGSPRSSGRG